MNESDMGYDNKRTKGNFCSFLNNKNCCRVIKTSFHKKGKESCNFHVALKNISTSDNATQECCNNYYTLTSSFARGNVSRASARTKSADAIKEEKF